MQSLDINIFVKHRIELHQYFENGVKEPRFTIRVFVHFLRFNERHTIWQRRPRVRASRITQMLSGGPHYWIWRPYLLIKTPLRNAFIYFINCADALRLTAAEINDLSRGELENVDESCTSNHDWDYSMGTFRWSTSNFDPKKEVELD